MIGKEVSHYRIVEKLGSGGMGVVYKAEDTKLKRTVALKFLRPDALLSEQDKARFIYEARAASALEHTNICSIYEVDETADGEMFISMPCYEGETLRHKIDKGPLKISDAVDIAIQIADGIEEAHGKGIIHRDIKSGNIIVTPKGQVKIMDFGLAKTERSTRLTTTGVTLGTVSYMSPEQAMGDKVDHRTDIWSTGVVLYEMLTGRLPFVAAHEQAVLYLVMNQDPEPVTALRTGVPMELERITAKAMAKRPEERYQSARELQADLGALKRKMESETLPAAVHAKPGSVRKRLVMTLLIPAAVAVALVVSWIVVGRNMGRGIPRSRPHQVTHADAWQMEPAISPDGGRIAYASNESGNFDIYVIDVRGGNPLRLTREGSKDTSPTWFPDGSSIAFVSDRTGQRSIWKIGQLGGTATLLVSDAFWPAVSPDGRSIAFSRASQEGNPRIAVASLDSPDRVNILTGPEDGLWEHIGPAWSRDGRKICYATRHNLWIVQSKGGDARRLTRDGTWDSEPAWSADGRHVYFSSGREGTLALWRVDEEGGRPERITMGIGSECSPSLSRDGTKLAYSTRSWEPNIVLRDTRSRKDIHVAGLSGGDHPAIAPDKTSVVFVSARWGPNTDLWLLPIGLHETAAEPVRLTDQAGNASHPVFSPDGRWVAYYRIVGEERDIWLVPSSGGQPIRFTDDPANDIHPAWSPDGTKLAFVSDRGGGPHIWVAPVRDGSRTGPATQVTGGELNAYAPCWSPDGKAMAFLGTKGNESEVWVVRADGSGRLEQVTRGADAIRVRWDASTSRLLVSGRWGGGDYILRRVSRDGAKTEDLVPAVWFGPEEGALFDVSKDGELIAYCQQKLKGNVWVLEAEHGSF
jgi:Tol biopolymer transport system component/tRNA A-37 threonylcarbamoyl transferase component Bud32